MVYSDFTNIYLFLPTFFIMKRFKLITIFFLFSITEILAQEKKIPLTLSFIDNSTSLPGYGNLGLFTSPHAGLTVGTYHNYKSNDKRDIFQNYKLGFFYHQLSQFAVQLYTETGYRYKFKNGFSVEGMAGGGYLHSFPDLQQFVFKNGDYVKKKTFGRPGVMATASIGIGYDLEKKYKKPIRLFIQYQFWIQAPFVKNYVPVLPNTALQVGARFYITKKEKKIKSIAPLPKRDF